MGGEELPEVVAGLLERVERLEAHLMRSGQSAVTDRALVEQLLAGFEGDVEHDSGGTVVYAGAGPHADGTVAWQINRSWPDVRLLAGAAAGALFAALANSTRIRIVCELSSGPLATGELAERLDQPSAGQLFHHLKELLAARVIYQPLRGVYAIRPENVVPLLAALSSAIDIAATDIAADST